MGSPRHNRDGVRNGATDALVRHWGYTLVVCGFLPDRAQAPHPSEYLDSLTLTDFFSKRFGDKRNILRAVAGLVTLIFMVGYVASQVAAAGKAFQGFMGMGYLEGALVSTIVIVIYTVLSGFRGVCYTDVIQGGFLLVGIVGLAIAGVVKLGGVGGLVEAISKQNPSLITVTGGRTLPALVAFIVAWLGSGAMGFGNPHVTVRVMAIKDDLQLRNAGLLAVACNVTAIYTGVWVGLAGRALFPVIADQELVFPSLAGAVFHPFIVGLFLGAVMAAIMSTSDSQLVLAATELSTNIIQGLLKVKNMSERTLVNLTRVFVVAIALVAMYFAFNAKQLVFWLVLFAWAGLGSAFGPLLIFSLYWKRTTLLGAIMGVVCGAVTVIIWTMTPTLKALIYEGVPGFVAASLAIVIFSYITRPPEGTEALFERMNRYFAARRDGTAVG